ncbi:MAG: hypothetical protein MHM6MM_008944 [Cercozoa sp. M6MM]
MSAEENKPVEEIKEDEEMGGLDEGIEEKVYKLMSSDGQEFELSAQDCKLSKLISNMAEADASATEYNLDEVDGATLGHVVRYLQHHGGKEPAEIKKPVRSLKMAKIVEDEFDAKFIDDFEVKDIFSVILAANYMDIQSLLNLGCAKIATMIKGKKPEDMKKVLSGESTEAAAEAS